MADKATLLALAERVEMLDPTVWKTGQALAKDVYRQLFDVPEPGRPNDYGWREDESGWWLVTGEDQRIPPKRITPPNWFHSLDAAMTLAVGLERFGGCSGLLREAMDRMLAASSPAWLAHVEPRRFAEALARYFTAACLRAKAATL